MVKWLCLALKYANVHGLHGGVILIFIGPWVYEILQQCRGGGGFLLGFSIYVHYILITAVALKGRVVNIYPLAIAIY